MLKVVIPENVNFADLRLSRDIDGHVSFEWGPIERVCAASGIDIALLADGPEDNVAGLMVAWYGAHLESGGARDAVQDDLIGEVMLENLSGDGMSHAPGRA